MVLGFGCVHFLTRSEPAQLFAVGSRVVEWETARNLTAKPVSARTCLCESRPVTGNNGTGAGEMTPSVRWQRHKCEDLNLDLQNACQKQNKQTNTGFAEGTGDPGGAEGGGRIWS